MTNEESQGTNHIQKVKQKTIHLSRNTAIALILLALLIAGIIAYNESGIGQPKSTPVNNPPYIEPVAPQYLPYNGTESSIFLASATPPMALIPDHQSNKWATRRGFKKGLHVS